MALRLADKKALVEEVNAVAGDSVTAVAAEYRGLSVSEMTELRKNARSAGVYMRVVKNTLAKRAVEGTDFACMQEGLKGPLILAFSQEDPGSAARVLQALERGGAMFSADLAAEIVGERALRVDDMLDHLHAVWNLWESA